MNMLRKTFCAVALGAVTLAPVVSTTVFAAPVAASQQEATQHLVRQLSGLHSLSANFEQTTKSNGKKTVQKKRFNRTASQSDIPWCDESRTSRQIFLGNNSTV